MKAYGGVDIYIHIFINIGLTAGEWSTSHPSSFTTREKAPGTHWIGGWVGPRAGLDDMDKRKFLTLPRLELRPLVVQPVARRYTDYAIPALIICLVLSLFLKIVLKIELRLK
jgi:hypothetical protein